MVDSVEYVKTNPLVGLEVSSLPPPTAPVVGNFRGVRQAQLELNQEADRVGEAQMEYQTASTSLNRANQELASARTEQSQLQTNLSQAQQELNQAKANLANAQSQLQSIQAQAAQARVAPPSPTTQSNAGIWQGTNGLQYGTIQLNGKQIDYNADINRLRQAKAAEIARTGGMNDPRLNAEIAHFQQTTGQSI